VEMESVVPVLTGLAPTKVTPLINTILNTFFFKLRMLVLS